MHRRVKWNMWRISIFDFLCGMCVQHANGCGIPYRPTQQVFLCWSDSLSARSTGDRRNGVTSFGFGNKTLPKRQVG